MLGKENATKSTILSNLQSNNTNNNFSQDELVKYWIEYANSLTIEKIYLKNTLINCKPVLKDHYTFDISVYNPRQRDEIVDNNVQIVEYLSNKLNNSQIKMDIRIIEKEKVEMIYSSVEKYDYLRKKNPNIEKLRELFNLSLE